MRVWMNYRAPNENGSFGTMVDKVQCDFHARIPRSNNKNMLIFEILPRTKPSGMNELPRKATEALKLRHKRVSGFTSGHHQKPPTVLLELTGVPVEGHDPPVVAALVVLGQLHGSSVQRRDSQVGDVFNLRNENSLSVDKKNISKLLLLTENIFNSYFKKSQL